MRTKIRKHCSKFRSWIALNQGIVTLLMIALILRIFLSPFGTLSLDQNTFISWSRMLATNGFSGFYQNWSDYLPGYLYVLRILGIFPDFFGTSVLYKIPAIIGDIATGFLVYLIAKKYFKKKRAEFAAFAFLFNPAILSNSTFWGQVDIFTALFPLIAIYTLFSNQYVSPIALAIGALIKPQAALAAPVILYLMIQKKWDLYSIARYISLSGAFFLLGFIPFYQEGSFIQFVVERVNAPLSQYPYTSVNAFNFWGLFGFWKPDSGTFPYQIAGYFLFFASGMYGLLRVRGRKMSEYLILSILFAANFLFFTRMHERHLLPLFAPLVIASLSNPILWVSYGIFSATYLANMRYAYVWIVSSFTEIFPPFVITFIIAGNLLAFSFLFIRLNKNIFPSLKSNFWNKKAQSKELRPLLTQRSVNLLLGGILAFALLTRLFMLHEPAKEYFDEVYHAFTARHVLQGDIRPWHWSNSAPEGYAFEWTHPPLAKEAMALGMSIFGEHSFGWRMPAVILSLFSIILVYKLGVWFANSREVGLLAAGALSIEGLFFVMSRIGMNDMYFLFFMLLSLWAFLTKRNFVSALALGCAAATKWSVIWFLPILAVSHFAFRRKITFGYLWFFVLPPLIYFASYIPMFLHGYDFQTFIDMQKQMWWYHTGLEATHAYTSPWYTWPFLIRPIYLYVGPVVDGMVSRIYAMGNPLVFWIGIYSVVLSIYYSISERNKKLGVLIFSYAVFFVSWALSPRIMFLYHYLPSIPFMTILIGYVLRRNKAYIVPFFVIGLLLFVYFYPHWTGLYIPEWLDGSYYWLPSWR